MLLRTASATAEAELPILSSFRRLRLIHSFAHSVIVQQQYQLQVEQQVVTTQKDNHPVLFGSFAVQCTYRSIAITPDDAPRLRRKKVRCCGSHLSMKPLTYFRKHQPVQVIFPQCKRTTGQFFDESHSWKGRRK